MRGGVTPLSPEFIHRSRKLRYTPSPSCWHTYKNVAPPRFLTSRLTFPPTDTQRTYNMSKTLDDVAVAAKPQEGLGAAEGQDLDPVKKNLADRLFAAQQSTETELKMSLMEAIRLYPMASMWSLLISFAVVMEGEENSSFTA